MTSAKWLEIEPRWVLIRDLILTQKGVYFAAVFNPGVPVGGDPYAHVVKWRGELYLEDGHSRMMRALIYSEPMLQARVLELKQEDFLSQTPEVGVAHPPEKEDLSWTT
jgi:hypothetical protein